MFRKPDKTIKTLIEQFNYPRLGPGMMWRAVQRHIEDGGGKVRLDSDVVRLERTDNRIDRVVTSSNGREASIEATDYVSSMPLAEVISKLTPPPPAEVVEAANRLRYRDLLTVCLIVNKEHLFDDNWIYIHDAHVKVGRIQNYKNWSQAMVPDANQSSLGLEYFCNEGDEIWDMQDEELVELGKREVDRLNLASYDDIADGCVFRVEKSYPVYDSGYQECLAVLREYVDGLENFQTIGRNGLHRYNNQDHAMLTGMLAVGNLLHGGDNCLWSVNTEKDYHEELRMDDHIEREYETMSTRTAERLTEHRTPSRQAA